MNGVLCRGRCGLLEQDKEAGLIRSQLKAQGVDIRWLSQRPNR